MRKRRVEDLELCILVADNNITVTQANSLLYNYIFLNLSNGISEYVYFLITVFTVVESYYISLLSSRVSVLLFSFSSALGTFLFLFLVPPLFVSVVFFWVYFSLSLSLMWSPFAFLLSSLLPLLCPFSFAFRLGVLCSSCRFFFDHPGVDFHLTFLLQLLHFLEFF